MNFGYKFFSLLAALGYLLVMTSAVQAAPTFQAAGTADNGTGSASPSWPVHAIDDIALLFVESVGDEPATLTTAAGFAAVANSPQNTGTGAGTRITVFWARATSTTMADPVVGDTGNHAYAQILTYRGVIDTGNPWNITGGGVKAAASTGVTVTGVTTTETDALIVQAVARDNDSTAAAFSAITNAGLTSIGERWDAGTTSGNGGGFAVWDGIKATAGATGNTTATVTSSINAFLTIALRQAPPSVVSINRASTNPTLANTAVSWTVVFSSSVTGVNAADFSLVEAGGVTGSSITSVTGSGTTWTVNADTGTGNAGTLGVNLVDNDSIIDSGSRPLGGAGAGNGNFTGQVYTLAPIVLSINLASTNPTSANATVSWTVIFSASVTGVGTGDFSLVQAGGTTGAGITAVSGSGTTWTVDANTGTGGVGTLGLNLVDNDSIVNSGNPLGGAGASNGNFTGQVYTLVPRVLSIVRASTDPANADDTVSWTVTFSTSVTGVNATDFLLVMGGGAAGASITSVSGAGTTWTVSATGGTSAGTLGLNLVDDDSIVGSSVALGGAGASNGDFTGQVYTLNAAFCSAPSNIPVGVTVTCVCDRFGRAALNPSTIYGGNWVVSTSDLTGIVPSIVNQGYLRITNNTANNAKAATVPGIFPAAGNYISVEFQHYAYNGSGADGIAVTLSDYSVPAVPGAFGGSLGYAQKSNPGSDCTTAGGCPGFAGGWVGIALDEWGNYSNPTEGRIGGPGQRADRVAVRGSGSGQTGYNWFATSAALAPGIDNAASATPAPGYFYQVIVDARNDPTSTAVIVNRDTGAGYATLVNIPDVYTAATAQGFTQAPVPTNWQISFTGATGGATNIHEIGGLRVCAQSAAPPSGGTASGFSAIDQAYGTPPSGPAVQNFLTGHIYTKLVGTAFQLNVAALSNNQILTTYAAGGPQNVTVRLVDNSDGVCILDSVQANYCNAACQAKPAITNGSQTVTFLIADAGKKRTANFTLNTAYKNLAVIVNDSTTTACSTDAFAVRPLSVASVTSSNATNTGTTGAPTFRAGADVFSLTATTTGIVGNPSGYTGTLRINNTADVGIQAFAPATFEGSVSPTLFPAATSGTPSSTVTGATFTYSEVGPFRFLGYNPASDTTTIRGVYDGVHSTTDCNALTVAQCDSLKLTTSWTGVDSITTRDDCVTNSYSNTANAAGKFGCLFGITANTGAFGRFTPHHFDTSIVRGCVAGAFTYSGQTFSSTTVTAENAAGVATRNFDTDMTGLSKNVTLSNGGTFVAGTFTNGTFAAAGFQDGAQTRTDVAYTFTAKETAPVTGAAGLIVRATDADLISSSTGTEGTTDMYSGRIYIQSAFGSELVDLAVPMRVQYYVDANTGWATFASDSCTTLTMSAFTNPQGGLAVSETCVQDIGSPGFSGSAPTTCAAVGPVLEQFREGGVAGFNGNFNLYLRTPGAGNSGSVDVSTNLGTLPWLRFNWDGAGGDDDPVGRATFGIYRGSPRHIHLRERY